MEGSFYVLDTFHPWSSWCWLRKMGEGYFVLNIFLPTTYYYDYLKVQKENRQTQCRSRWLVCIGKVGLYRNYTEFL